MNANNPISDASRLNNISPVHDVGSATKKRQERPWEGVARDIIKKSADGESPLKKQKNEMDEWEGFFDFEPEEINRIDDPLEGLFDAETLEDIRLEDPLDFLNPELEAFLDLDPLDIDWEHLFKKD